MKVSRKLVLCLALVVSVAMATGGTLAYLTGTDTATNTFTLGDVSIDLLEPAWPSPSSAPTLLPGVDIKKDPQIKNTGNTDAWVWMEVSMPTNLYKVLELDWNTNSSWSAKTEEVDGTNTVVTLKWTEKLAANTSTTAAFTKVWLDKTIENKDLEGLDNSINIDVKAYAIQTETLADIDAAYNAYNGESSGEGDGDQEPSGTVVDTLDELKAAVANGGTITLGADISGNNETIAIAEGTTVVLDLNNHTITNPIAGGAALENNGTLTLKNGSVVNGTNSTRASHTIVNKGTLTIVDGTYGTDDTAGAAVVNYGDTTINGGTFASKQADSVSDNLCAYAFINQNGTMTVNNATLNGQTHGLFGAYGGTITVNGGSYTMDGNNGLGCYVVYATGEGKVELEGGTINTNEPRNDRVFYVSDNGNHFNQAAVDTGKVVVGDAKIYLNGAEQTYN